MISGFLLNIVVKSLATFANDKSSTVLVAVSGHVSTKAQGFCSSLSSSGKFRQNGREKTEETKAFEAKFVVARLFLVNVEL